MLFSHFSIHFQNIVAKFRSLSRFGQTQTLFKYSRSGVLMVGNVLTAVRTLDAGAKGVSGMLLTSSGWASSGSSGGVLLGTGSSEGGYGGAVRITVGSGDSGASGDPSPSPPAPAPASARLFRQLINLGSSAVMITIPPP